MLLEPTRAPRKRGELGEVITRPYWGGYECEGTKAQPALDVEWACPLEPDPSVAMWRCELGWVVGGEAVEGERR